MKSRFRDHCEYNEEVAQHNDDIQEIKQHEEEISWSSQELESPSNTNSATLELFSWFMKYLQRKTFIFIKSKKSRPWS